MNMNGNKCLDSELQPGWVGCGDCEIDALERSERMLTCPGGLAPCSFPRLLTLSAVGLAHSRCFALKECLEVEAKFIKAFFFWRVTPWASVHCQ